ncbi:hypothetical protein HanXRQr2_Chr09g0400531 [Helianthus annuus]|nr:hypothetical protein HanXRQr2_Chr09g0400531 [Helianthus annuus]KAJ0894193.1 hypothetical protein HanPSC8_Chr09g0386301 [Helianthus annuus]
MILEGTNLEFSSPSHLRSQVVVEEDEPQSRKKRSVAWYGCAVVEQKSRTTEKKGKQKDNMVVERW